MTEPQSLLAHYRTMVLIRTVESRLSRLFADNEIPGFLHLSIGQEAVAAGVMSSLGDGDSIATTHRGHGHVVARGIDLDGFFGEIMGKRAGICGGRGGSMHVADVSQGILGANGIVGAGIPIALGAGIAHSVRKTGCVAVVFFGDGAMAEGVLHETMNIASLWRVPLLLVCENNGWSEFSASKDVFAGKLSALAPAFGIEYRGVDGSDVREVAAQAAELVARMRAGLGPAVLECRTHRTRGHYEGDPQTYRPAQEVADGLLRDPIARAAAWLLEAGTAQSALDEVQGHADARVTVAVDRARADTVPDWAAALADVYTPVANAVGGSNAPAATAASGS